MKLHCPSCHSEIGPSAVNLSEGIAQCPACGDVFRVADHVRGDQAIHRTAKPAESQIQHTRQGDSHTFTIPPDGWSISASGQFVCASFLLFMSWLSLLDDQLFMCILIGVLGGSILFYALFTVLGQTEIQITPQTISVLFFLFGLSRTKIRQTQNLKKILEDSSRRQHGEPIYQIEMTFSEEKALHFGALLADDERTWLIGELYEATRPNG